MLGVAIRPEIFYDIAGVCWGTFVAAWVLGAAYNAWRSPKAIGGASSWNLPRSLLAGLALIVAYRVLPRTAWSDVLFWNLYVAVAGAVLLVVSTVLALWARVTLGRMWSYAPEVREHHELVTNGPYRITRHPIYTSILGMLLGSAMMWGFGPFLLLVIGFGLVFAYRIPREEKLMTQTFGEQYIKYQREVPRLIPFFRH